MALSCSLTFSNATTGQLAWSGLSGAATTVDAQIAMRNDFAFTPAPILSVPTASPLALPGLNHATTYAARVRGRYSDGHTDSWCPVALATTPAAAYPDTSPQNIMLTAPILVLPEPVISWSSQTAVVGYDVANLGRAVPVPFLSYSASQAHSFEAQTTGQAVDVFALLVSNLPEAATVTLKGGASLANVRGGSPTYSYGPVPFRASPSLPGRDPGGRRRTRGWHGFVQLPAAKAYQFWRVEIAAALPGDTMHLEHCVIGLNRSTKPMSVDKKETPQDLGTLSRQRSGMLDRAIGFTGRQVDFEIPLVREEQYETKLGDLIYHLNSPIFAVPNGLRGSFFHDRMVYGDFIAGVSDMVNSPVFTQPISISSII